MRLNWLRRNQDKLRVEKYSGFRDAVRNETDLNGVGRPVVLPSSFTGGPRYMQQLYQDAMAICRRKGKPDLFITMTCNPQWPEVQDALLPGQQANDRPDLLARVFRLKLKALIHDLTKDHVLGHCIAFCQVCSPHA